ECCSAGRSRFPAWFSCWSGSTPGRSSHARDARPHRSRSTLMAIAAGHPLVPEAHDPHPTSTGLNSRKMVFWAFLGSECMLFGSLIATYVVYRGRDTVGPHPHEILNIPFTSVSAFVLLMSSLTMVLALAAVQRGDLRGSR